MEFIREFVRVRSLPEADVHELVQLVVHIHTEMIHQVLGVRMAPINESPVQLAPVADTTTSDDEPGSQKSEKAVMDDAPTVSKNPFEKRKKAMTGARKTAIKCQSKMHNGKPCRYKALDGETMCKFHTTTTNDTGVATKKKPAESATTGHSIQLTGALVQQALPSGLMVASDSGGNVSTSTGAHVDTKVVPDWLKKVQDEDNDSDNDSDNDM